MSSMDLYRLILPALFKLEPEISHHLSLKSLQLAEKTGLKFIFPEKPIFKPVSAMGLQFPNRIGLAAGFDKNGDYIDALALLGFGFIEVGTVTPRPQSGNPKPRLFRLPKSKAIINRMGFNNKGIAHLVARVKEAKYKGIIGINIGKNFDTPIDKAASDYLTCLKKAYAVADYITINISSPNTPYLRSLQQARELTDLMGQLKEQQRRLHETYHKYVPIVFKIAPDLDNDAIKQIAELSLKNEIDGIIATNTTISRDGIIETALLSEAGGLSGAPLTRQATHVVSKLDSIVKDQLAIIAVGGIMNGQDALEKFEAGAQLIQLYSGLIYKGPKLVQEIGSELSDYASANPTYNIHHRNAANSEKKAGR